MRRRILVLLAVSTFVVAVLTGAAFGFLSSHGTGVASAATGTIQPVTVSALTGGDSPSSTLVPGGSSDVILRVNNPNAFAVTLVTVSGNGTITVDGAHSACTTSGVTFTNETGLSVRIAASGTTLVHLANAANMSTSSSSGCQGATFSIPVSVTVQV